jgi:hypothetical protein
MCVVDIAGPAARKQRKSRKSRWRVIFEKKSLVGSHKSRGNAHEESEPSASIVCVYLARAFAKNISATVGEFDNEISAGTTLRRP